MIKAVLFDFGQTLVDSADGFRQAEKEAQAAIFRDLAITDRDAFMRHYRSIRAEFHQESKLSRFEIWRAVYRSLRCEPSAERLRHWEQAYWRTVQEHTRVFAEAPGVLGDLVARNKPIGLVTNTQGQVDAGAHRIAAFPELADGDGERRGRSSDGTTNSVRLTKPGRYEVTLHRWPAHLERAHAQGRCG